MYTFLGSWGDSSGIQLDETRDDEEGAIQYACWACVDWEKVEVSLDGVVVGHARIGRDNQPVWVAR